MDYQIKIAEVLHQVLQDELSVDEIIKLLEKPKSDDHGDLAFPAFQLAKVFRKAPQEIAADLADQIQDPLIHQVQAVGPYLNFFLNRQAVGEAVVKEVIHAGPDFGGQDIGKSENVVLDMSSPNIAKPMSMGHLRSTVIGNALANIYQKVNFNTVKINYLGDWGTQFGKLICAYKKWGDPDKVRANPIQELNELYVHFHEVAEDQPELEDEGREWFRRLENGDEEAIELWEWFREESLKEFNKVYDRLEITFDSFNGEAYYNDKMEEIVQLIDDKGLLKEDKGAQVVYLDAYDLNPALIKKQDGATLYMTRDVTAAIDRYNKFEFNRALYVVGQDQNYHFSQLQAVLKEMGYDWADKVLHIAFGLISIDGEKMSTRRGKVVLLNDVLDEAVDKAYEQISEKNPDLDQKEAVAEEVGVGAVIFNDLHNERTNNFDFDLDEIVKFEGETGPYVQYSRARAMSILRKAVEQGIDYKNVGSYSLTDDYSWKIIKNLQEFPAVIAAAYEKNEPSIVARHAVRMASAFNQFYANVRVLDESEERPVRLALVHALTIVLKESLRLLGVASPDKM